jgi:inhibitor of KinA
VRFEPLGDRAVLVVLGDGISEATHRRVRTACERLAVAKIEGVIEWVPAYTSLAVHYDPARVSADSPFVYEHVVRQLEAALAGGGEGSSAPGRRIDIPVCYEGELAPDLEDVAALHGMPPAEVISIHSSAEYLVYMLGFMPGFAYMGGLDERVATPRRSSPRTAVPAGTVGIGGSQTGVYPLVSPGGWNLIGRTPVAMFRPDAADPVLLHAGDRVRFRPISRAEFDGLREDA